MRLVVAGLIASLAAAVGCFLAARRTRIQDGQPGGPPASLTWWLFGIGALWSVVDLGALVLMRPDPPLLRLGVFPPLILLVAGTATYPTIRGLWSLLDQLVVATAVLTIILLVGEVQAPHGAVIYDSYWGWSQYR
jgi:hypothetical protein